eukprot:174708_1
MLNELLKSRHYRLKIECLMLLMYTMFNCNGLIWLTSMHLDFESQDHINFFTDENFAGIGLSCVFSLASVAFFWLFAIRILIHYYHKEKDTKWMEYTKLYGKIASVFWILSMMTWTITVLFAQIDVWFFKLALAFIPAWNKSLCIGIIYSIFYEFNPAVSRTQRVVRWISIITIFLSVYVAILSLFCGIAWLMWFFSWMAGAQYVVSSTVIMLCLSCVLTPIYNLFFILWDQLRPNFVFKYYMICVPCCCGCFCHDNWCRCCVPNCCLGRDHVKITTWLIVGMYFVWNICTVVFNNNECLAQASLMEYAFGFRGAAILVVLFSVLINVELTYAGPVKNRNVDTQRGTVSLQVASTIQTPQQGDAVIDEEIIDDNIEAADDGEEEEEDLAVR